TCSSGRTPAPPRAPSWPASGSPPRAPTDGSASAAGASGRSPSIPHPATSARAATRCWRERRAAAVAVGVLIADQVTKAIVDATMVPGQLIPLLPFCALAYVRNTGAAFGMFAAVPAALRLPAFLAITAIALAALLSFLRQTPADRPWVIAALGAVLGGAAGNLVCRLRYGEVIDFVDLHWGGL